MHRHNKVCTEKVTEDTSFIMEIVAEIQFNCSQVNMNNKQFSYISPGCFPTISKSIINTQRLKIITKY